MTAYDDYTQQVTLAQDAVIRAEEGDDIQSMVMVAQRSVAAQIALVHATLALAAATLVGNKDLYQVQCPTCLAVSDPGANALLHVVGCDNTAPLRVHKPAGGTDGAR